MSTSKRPRTTHGALFSFASSFVCSVVCLPATTKRRSVVRCTIVHPVARESNSRYAPNGPIQSSAADGSRDHAPLTSLHSSFESRDAHLTVSDWLSWVVASSAGEALQRWHLHRLSPFPRRRNTSASHAVSQRADRQARRARGVGPEIKDWFAHLRLVATLQPRVHCALSLSLATSIDGWIRG